MELKGIRRILDIYETKTMEKLCSICRINFIPTNLNAETRHCCKQCIKELSQLKH